MYNSVMVMSYREVLEKYGSRRKIENAISSKELFRTGRNLYSTSPCSRDEAIISALHPSAIFTLNSAFFLYGLTDVIPDHFFLATPFDYTRIKDADISQGFQSRAIFEIGSSYMETANGMVHIYDKERLLIELVRFRKRFGFDYYKEIVANYRKIAGEIDANKITSYLEKFKYGDGIMKTILKEVF